MTTRGFGPSMRAAAAEARAVLVGLASEQLGVPVTQLEVSNGIITDTKNSKSSVTYAQLAKGKRIEKHLDSKPTLEDYTKFSYVGKSYKHSDAKIKVTGEAKYTGDLKLPGMVFARILRPPSHGLQSCM
jgi:nicotinate dehydrogenase subunit B